MFAALYKKCGLSEKVLELSEVQYPAINNAKEVIVKIEYSGINPFDIKVRSGKKGEVKYPFQIPHSDASGVVVQKGKNVKNLKIGQRVWVHSAAWKRQHGTAAEFCSVPENLVAPLPERTSFSQGACLGIPALTAASALLSLNLTEKSNILITGGAGVVGNACIQLARFLGHNVFATARSDKKIQISKESGVTHVFDSRKSDFIDNIGKVEKFDAVIDVDFANTVGWAHKILKESGKIVTYASSKIDDFDLPLKYLISKNININFLSVFLFLENDSAGKAVDLVNRALEKSSLKLLEHKIFDFNDIVLAHREVEKPDRIGQVLLKI
ncbi:MAG: NADPH:quinone reductase [Rickettsiales bacterium]